MTNHGCISSPCSICASRVQVSSSSVTWQGHPVRVKCFTWAEAVRVAEHARPYRQGRVKVRRDEPYWVVEYWADLVAVNAA